MVTRLGCCTLKYEIPFLIQLNPAPAAHCAAREKQRRGGKTRKIPYSIQGGAVDALSRTANLRDERARCLCSQSG